MSLRGVASRYMLEMTARGDAQNLESRSDQVMKLRPRRKDHADACTR